MINCTSFYLPTTICLAQGQIDLVYSGSAEPGKWMLMAFMRHSPCLQVFEFGGQTRINPLYRLQSHPPCSVCQNYKSVKWTGIRVENSRNSCTATNNLSCQSMNHDS